MNLPPLISALMLAWTMTTEAAETVLLDENVSDWTRVQVQADSSSAALVLLVTSPGCGYCAMLKQDVLRPMQREGAFESRALVRELDLDAGRKIVDFDGEKIRARLFLKRYKVFAAPTVLFLDRDGHPLHAPIVGFNGVEKYRPLFDEALRESRMALERLRTDVQRMAGTGIHAGASAAN